MNHAFRHLRPVGTDRSHPSNVAIYLCRFSRSGRRYGHPNAFHDAVLMAVDGAGAKLVPVGPPNRYEEVVSHPNVILWACRPCVDARGG
ncbi:MAG: hypothetical protein WA231_24140 [Methylocella sp.]